MKLLLDTCAFLWLALEPRRFGKTATRLFNDPASEVFLSDASVWEITLKHGAGKLPLPETPGLWIPSRRSFFQARRLRLEESDFYRSHELPRVHADPFDRILAAQAIEHGLTLLSPDEPLSALGARRAW